jgi:hypothetical protein
MSTDKILIFQSGTIVRSKTLDLSGRITAIEIRFESIVYEFSYPFEGEIKKTWIHESEFETTEQKKEIGFKKQQ